MINAQATSTARPIHFRAEEIPKLLVDLLSITRLDIQKGMEEQVGLDGQPFPKLSRLTVKIKSQPHPVTAPGRLAIPAAMNLNAIQRASIARGASSFSRKKGGLSVVGGKKLFQQQARFIAPFPEKALIDSGNLLYNQTSRFTSNEAVMTIGPTRLEIGRKLQVEGVGRNRKRFLFFGISGRAQSKIVTYLQKKFRNGVVEVVR